MAILVAQLFFFPGQQPIQSLHCLGPEPLLLLDLCCYELKEGPGQVELEARGKDWGIQHSGSRSCGSELRLLAPLQALELGQGGLIDILRALLKGERYLLDT